MGILLVKNSAMDSAEWTKVGSRYPGIFFHGKNKLLLIKHFLGKKPMDLKIKQKDLLAVDTPLSFKISQEMEKGKLMYKVNQFNEGLKGWAEVYLHI